MTKTFWLTFFLDTVYILQLLMIDDNLNVSMGSFN